MKTTKYGILVALMLSIFFAACKSDDDDVTYTDECYISSFVLGQLKRQVVTSDTTFMVSFSGSLYPLSIDQLKQTITNNEPLPQGTILSAALATITAQGSVIYTPASDTTQWKAYSSTDSINFSEPLLFRVYPLDGSVGYRQYPMSLNVRQNDPTSFTWSQPALIDSLADKVSGKLLFLNQTPVVLATDLVGRHSVITGTVSPDKVSFAWTEQPCTGTENGNMQQAQVYDGRLWMSTTDGKLLTSADGVQWEDVPQAEGVSVQLMAASDSALYACIQNTQDDTSVSYAASADGQTWVNVGMEHGERFAGTEAAVAYTQGNGNRRVLIASDVHHSADAPLAVWSLLEGTGEPWILFSIEDGINPYLLPNQTPLNLVAYNGWLVAVTQQSFRFSYDNGITWKNNTNLLLPADMATVTGPFTAAAQGEYIWVIAGKRCWRLRYNGYQE